MVMTQAEGVYMQPARGTQWTLINWLNNAPFQKKSNAHRNKANPKAYWEIIHKTDNFASLYFTFIFFEYFRILGKHYNCFLCFTTYKNKVHSWRFNICILNYLLFSYFSHYIMWSSYSFMFQLMELNIKKDTLKRTLGFAPCENIGEPNFTVPHTHCELGGSGSPQRMENIK